MDPFVAEIRIAGFHFAPKGWAFCNGQLLPIAQNTALFSLLGTTYGGDGKSNFALPNLQGCAPMHPGQGPGLSLRFLGETAGEDSVTLTASETPSHTHTVQADAGAATTGTPAPGMKLGTADTMIYTSPVNLQPTAAATISPVGGQPHNNRQPYLGLTFIIAMQGVFPPRT